MPITSPALTILDIAGAAGEKTFGRALNEARVQHVVTDRELHATIARHPNRKGAARLRAKLRSELAPFATENDAEEACLELMIGAGIPPDETQARFPPYRVDFYYRAERLAVELESFRFHYTPDRFAHDQKRQASGRSGSDVATALPEAGFTQLST